MFGYIKVIFTVVIISAIAGAGMYVMKLRSDNAVLKANQIELERSIESQRDAVRHHDGFAVVLIQLRRGRLRLRLPRPLRELTGVTNE